MYNFYGKSIDCAIKVKRGRTTNVSTLPSGVIAGTTTHLLLSPPDTLLTP